MKEIKNMIDSGDQENMPQKEQQTKSSTHLDKAPSKPTSGLSKGSSFPKEKESKRQQGLNSTDKEDVLQKTNSSTSKQPLEKNNFPEDKNTSNPMNTTTSDSLRKEQQTEFDKQPSTRETPKNQAESQKPSENRHREVGAEERNGTLFLKVKRFEKVKETIQEMKKLSNQIEGTMDNLETGLEQDKKTEEDTQSILNEFKNRQKTVKDLIDTEEEN